MSDLRMSLLSLVLAVGSFAFVTVTWRAVVRPHLLFRRSAIPTVGTVVGIRRRTEFWPSNPLAFGMNHFPVVDFAVESGRNIRATSRVGKVPSIWRPPFRIGEQVRIAYDPNDPDDVRWRDYRSSAAVFGRLLAIAILTGTAGTAMLIYQVINGLW
ncbi:DUF3592 domain-containing protein [Actinoallomurus bryophytorum]|uniref:DUF3592 domain-containing protein n=1 Tax=Actinoallomurus bryophytorum TaxID=1490222 RepID=UPI001154350E|nr:DUF3592 domain-containing protein [Actinoallomurus bryophytorum]